ncbi:hypothetical protein WAK64_21970 [Bacillus spongiae]|uniref:Uncharacterized protein n=1 Tax=Bacillus spongiae TaxID=2683610 RepID=A0ABU8HJV1_9BACI
MNEYETVKDVCQKFIENKYNIGDLSRALSWVAVPIQIQEKVDEAEFKIEKIRFLVPDNEQYEEALDVIRDLLSEVKELESK